MSGQSGSILHSKWSRSAVQSKQPHIHWVLGQFSPSIKLTIHPRHSKHVAIHPPLSMCLQGLTLNKHWFNFPFTLTTPHNTKAVLLQWFINMPTTPQFCSQHYDSTSPLLLTLWDKKYHNNGTKASAYHHPLTPQSSWHTLWHKQLQELKQH
jgi:hypothetical protein